MAVIYRLTGAEESLADIIWANAPLSTNQLVRLAEKSHGWKRTTTYTILKRLCDKGIFANTDATVSALVSQDEFRAGLSRRYVEDSFGGSLPLFMTSFFGGKKLSRNQAEELRRLIDEYEAGENDG